MHLFRETLVLFLLNLLDAVLTLVWVTNGIAEEGNHLMAMLLEIGPGMFLGVKLAIGAFAAFVLLRWGDRPLARYGVTAALAVYIGVMAIHFVTFLSAAGLMAGAGIEQLPRAAGALSARL